MAFKRKKSEGLRRVFEIVEFFVGLFMIISALVYLVTGTGESLVFLFLMGYVIAPLLFMFIDYFSGKIQKSFSGLILAPVYYLLSSWHEILYIFIILPGVAVSMIMGPVSAVLAFSSGACLIVGAFQFIAGSTFGLDNLASAGALFVFGPVFLVSSLMLFLVFVKKADPGEWISSFLDGFFEKALESLRNRVFIRPYLKKNDM